MHGLALASCSTAAAVVYCAVPQPIAAALTAAFVVYASSFAAATASVSRARTLFIVALLTWYAAFVACAVWLPIEAPEWTWVTVSISCALATVGASLGALGFLVGNRFAPASSEDGPDGPHPAPTPVRAPLSSSKRRDERSLDELPDSWRGVVFAVRLRRREFERASRLSL